MKSEKEKGSGKGQEGRNVFNWRFMRRAFHFIPVYSGMFLGGKVSEELKTDILSIRSLSQRRSQRSFSRWG